MPANLINATHQISEEMGALSLIKRLGNDYSHLILEEIDAKGEYKMTDVYLAKQSSDDRCAIVIRREIDEKQLQEVAGSKCVGFTWELPRGDIEQFNTLINNERKKSKRNEIHYLKLQNQSHSASLLHNFLEDEKASQLHNCNTWAIAIVKEMKLSTPTHWNPCRVSISSQNNDKKQNMGCCNLM